MLTETVEGKGVAMVAAEEAATAAVEQVEYGRGGGGTVYVVLIILIYCHTVETSLCLCSVPSSFGTGSKLDSIESTAFCVFCSSTGL